MTKIEKTIWDLAQLYDFYQKIKQYRIKGPQEKEKDPKLRIKESKTTYKKRRLPRKPKL